ncbi:hypothetical protein KAFR_0A05060 [Kazachstania africana CBS 2517]|uniref:U three protein 23 n=1 Tax=Kazachstania africana (strain ATCC 22294 / BCRC 22015 / CBS 2517 / CECT 1963 / NBRC 1671 / NRRL Y-8276) TaxID=1071382 RepID=H2ANJ2_KAZAF|nr:hypothetical protein KAFR_0A05060 [Kazachstania africana CBS 2517]CCF55942.1 hypothetical protein KAFR_0A05060 [Kazachstania africana CBS 2517]
MRQKRAKSYRKQLLVYSHTFKFREPYQVLVDNEIVTVSSNSNFDLVKGLKRTLQAEVKPMITQCCMQALYETRDQNAIDMAKGFERRRCNHPPKEPKTPIECVLSVVNVNGKNKHRYVVASQDIDIRRQLRRVPGVPLVHISRSVMIMEPLSDTSAKISSRMEQEKLYKGLNDPKYAGLKLDEEEATETQGSGEKTAKKKRGPKGPNPLSVRKKVKTLNEPKQTDKNDDVQEETTEKKKRRRKHRPKKDTGINEDTNINDEKEYEQESN